MDIHWVRVPMIEPTWKFTTGIKERRLKPRSCNNVCCDFRSWVYLVYSLVEACFWGRTWTSESFILSHWSIVSIVSKDATAETSMILHGLCGPCFGNSNYLEQCCFSAWLVRSALDCLELTEHANAATMKSLSGVTACLNSFDQQISCFRKSIDIACFSPQGYYGFHVHCLHSHMVLNMKEVCSAVDLCTAYCRLLDSLRCALQEVQY